MYLIFNIKKTEKKLNLEYYFFNRSQIYSNQPPKFHLNESFRNFNNVSRMNKRDGQ